MALPTSLSTYETLEIKEKNLEATNVEILKMYLFQKKCKENYATAEISSGVSKLSLFSSVWSFFFKVY